MPEERRAGEQFAPFEADVQRFRHPVAAGFLGKGEVADVVGIGTECPVDRQQSLLDDVELVQDDAVVRLVPPAFVGLAVLADSFDDPLDAIASLLVRGIAVGVLRR